jgi:hypothetical protein
MMSQKKITFKRDSSNASKASRNHVFTVWNCSLDITPMFELDLSTFGWPNLFGKFSLDFRF